ncbi:MAG: aspartate carbamoyltransferase regulatory subunit [Candidatus Hydrothermarchaeota archaeon]
MEEELKVKKIRNGTVIDHIQKGKALIVLKILGVDHRSLQTTVSVAMNVPSEKMGSKDIVKVEGRELAEDEVNKIALISSEATINIIRDYKVVEKRKVALPPTIEAFLKCPNPDCITNDPEPIKTKFFVETTAPVRLRCYYCERLFEGIEEYI